MKKPKWRKYKDGWWRRGVLEVCQSMVGDWWNAFGCSKQIDNFNTPEEAMKAADKW